MRILGLFTTIVLLAASAHSEEIKLATYNVEYFNAHFLAHQLTTCTAAQDRDGKAMLTELRKKNDEDNWETAEVILDPKFSPDILAIEEGCMQRDLEYFNTHWLHDAYETVMQFSGNSDRHQMLNLLLKKSFKVLEVRDKYYLEPDPVGNERGERLFARGPVFVKVQSPGGYVFWVGLTHMKSKSMANPPTTGTVARATPAASTEEDGAATGKETSDTRARKIEVTKWRNREGVRTHAIMKELQQAGPADLMLLGDMNDSIGMDAYEPDGGGDAIMSLVGPPEDGFILATKPLADQNQISFHGYWRTGFRELLDHVILTPSMKDQVEDVQIYTDGLARVSSDHFPVMIRIKTH